MKIAKVIHNPTAGDEEHSKKELISLLKAKGFEGRYSSVKEKGWKKIDPDIEFLIAAGGDGTIRRIVETLVKRKVLQKTWPIALLPLGTANNIARTLSIEGTTEEIIDSWSRSQLKKFDVGRVYDLDDTKFFLEGLGYGIFPYLLLELNKQSIEHEHPEMEIKAAQSLLHEIVLSYEPRHCELEVDGINHSGKFLMAEIMNTRSIGPNLVLAPDADPGDGEFEVVLLPEKYKERFASYVLNKMNGVEEEYRYDTFKGKNIRIRWDGSHVHVDGDVVKMGNQIELKIELKEGLVEFLVPRGERQL